MLIFLFSIKRPPHSPLSQRFSKRGESGREVTHLEKGCYPGFQVFHDVPVVRPRQVQISVRETYSFQQDAQEFRDIIPSDIQKNPEQGRNIENMEALEINQLMLVNRSAQRNFGPKKVCPHLVSGTTNPSSTQAMLVTAAPRFTTQAVDIPAP